MGWKLQWQHRLDFLGDALRYQSVRTNPADVAPETLVCDGNALFRSNCVGTRPAATMVKQVLAQAGFPQSCMRLVVCFDNNNIPPARAAVHAARAARVKQCASPAEIKAATIYSLGSTTWENLFANTAGKIAAFQLILVALQQEVVRLYTQMSEDSPMFEVVVSLPYAEEVWRYPNNRAATISDPNTQYGEAEAQAVFVVEELVMAKTGPVVVLTIDTDIILQLMGIYTKQVYIRIAKVWNVTPKAITASNKRKRGGSVDMVGDSAEPVQYRTLRLATKAKDKTSSIEPMFEYISCAAIQRRFGPDAASIMNTMLWMLLAAGVDYNKGLCQFGWSSHRVLTLSQVPVVHSLTIGAVTVDITAICKALLGLKRRTPKSADLANGLVSELNDTLYCFAYYLWYDQVRKGAAGPRVRPFLANYSLLTIPQFLRKKHDPVKIVNLYPHAVPVVPLALARQPAFKRYIAAGSNRFSADL